jgi:hypothetical protein
MGKVYVGARTEAGCTVEVLDIGRNYALLPRNDLRNHSPAGFEWGYGGSGPAQLALALLADAVSDHFALDHYQQFKRARIGRLKGDEWSITAQTIQEWAQDQPLALGQALADEAPKGGDA